MVPPKKNNSTQALSTEIRATLTASACGPVCSFLLLCISDLRCGRLPASADSHCFVRVSLISLFLSLLVSLSLSLHPTLICSEYTQNCRLIPTGDKKTYYFALCFPLLNCSIILDFCCTFCKERLSYVAGHLSCWGAENSAW